MKKRLLTNCELSRFRKRPEHTFHQRGIAIFLDLLDLAVLDPVHHAILVVVAKPGFGDVVAARFDHDEVAVRDEIITDGSRSLRKEGAEMTHQAVLNRIASAEPVRP